MIFARDDQSDMANIYGATLTTGGAVAEVPEWPDRIKAVTPEQVRAVAMSRDPTARWQATCCAAPADRGTGCQRRRVSALSFRADSGER